MKERIPFKQCSRQKLRFASSKVTKDPTNYKPLQLLSSSAPIYIYGYMYVCYVFKYDQA